jgi:hypothetical protein
MVANTPQSRKAKGRNLQKWIREKLIDILGIHPEDVESRAMGSGGEDVILAKAARDVFPYSVEAKNTEKIQVWSAYDQAIANAKEYEPIVVFKKNHRKPLVAIDAEAFFKLVRKANRVYDHQMGTKPHS